MLFQFILSIIFTHSAHAEPASIAQYQIFSVLRSAEISLVGVVDPHTQLATFASCKNLSESGFSDCDVSPDLWISYSEVNMNRLAFLFEQHLKLGELQRGFRLDMGSAFTLGTHAGVLSALGAKGSALGIILGTEIYYRQNLPRVNSMRIIGITHYVPGALQFIGYESRESLLFPFISDCLFLALAQLKKI